MWSVGKKGNLGPMLPISPSHLLGTQAALLGLQVVTKARAPVLRPIPQLRVSTQLLLHYKQGLQPGSITQGSGTDCEEGTQDHSEGIYCSRHVPQRPCSGHVQSSFSSSCSGFCKHYKTAIGLWRMRKTTYRNRNSNSLSSQLWRLCLTQWSHKLNVRLQSQNTWRT